MPEEEAAIKPLVFVEQRQEAGGCRAVLIGHGISLQELFECDHAIMLRVPAHLPGRADVTSHRLSSAMSGRGVPG